MYSLNCLVMAFKPTLQLPSHSSTIPATSAQSYCQYHSRLPAPANPHTVLHAPETAMEIYYCHDPPNVVCYYCHKPNHLSTQCIQKHEDLQNGHLKSPMLSCTLSISSTIPSLFLLLHCQ